MNNKLFSVPSSLNEIGRIRSEIQSISIDFNLTQEKVIDIELILVELFTNIVEHGYRGDTGNVQFLLSSGAREMKMEIVDSAAAYFPTMLQTIMPKVNSDIHAIQEHGYGIPLVVSLINSITFERAGDQNKTTVVICLE